MDDEGYDEQDYREIMDMADMARDDLDECAAERDRLRVIVDLACAEHEANYAHTHRQPGDPPPSETWKAWDDAMAARNEAVAAEVARRARS